jgi:hypothetical protein
MLQPLGGLMGLSANSLEGLMDFCQTVGQELISTLIEME